MSFYPENNLEKAIISSREGVLPVRDLISMLLVSKLVVPSATEIQADGSGLTPLFFNKEGVGMLAAFTSISRVKEFTSVAKYCLEIRALDLLKGVPMEYGIVI